MNIIIEKIPIFLKNKEILTNFLNNYPPILYKNYKYVRNGGKSSYEVFRKLHKQLPPSIINNLTTYINKIVKNKYKLTDMWTNIHHPQSYTARHNHFADQYPLGISGGYYLKKPKNSGNIVFDEEGVVDVHENDLLIFHQFKNRGDHWTERNNSNEDRIIISFNMLPNESK